MLDEQAEIVYYYTYGKDGRSLRRIALCIPHGSREIRVCRIKEELIC